MNLPVLIEVLRDFVRVVMGVDERQRTNHHEIKELIMSLADDLNAKIGTLTQTVNDQSSKIDDSVTKQDLVLAALTDVRAQLTTMQSQGGGASDAQITGMATAIDGAIATLTASSAKLVAESDKDTAALNPATTVDPAAPAA